MPNPADLHPVALALITMLMGIGPCFCPHTWTGPGGAPCGEDDEWADDGGSGHVDADGDGWSEDWDCDDTDPTLNWTDYDGDGCASCEFDCDDKDPSREALDQDGDGWTTCRRGCDDHDPDRNPGASEWCNGVDDDCDGVMLFGEEIDLDGDGSLWCDDCDDDDPALNNLDQDGDGDSTCDGD